MPSRNLIDTKRESRPLQEMFSGIPDRYDLLNRLLTFRMDEIWRRIAVKSIQDINPSRFLDLGCGTGDLASRAAKTLKKNCVISCMDFSEPMIKQARKKIERIGRRMNFILADASEIPIRSKSIDVVGISFAFRNITWKNRNRHRILSEIYRVLAPGGKLIIIESSQPRSTVIRFLFHLYLNFAVAGPGGLISGHRGAYRYLARSAKDFYTIEELTSLLRGAGFRQVQNRKLNCGIAALTIAEK
jgi:demethylmenaquinone methyltransferase/2-methoxy-6-polyprenyl-1,4-benzoquinol methylase